MPSSPPSLKSTRSRETLLFKSSPLFSPPSRLVCGRETTRRWWRRREIEERSRTRQSENTLWNYRYPPRDLREDRRVVSQSVPRSRDPHRVSREREKKIGIPVIKLSRDFACRRSSADVVGFLRFAPCHAMSHRNMRKRERKKERDARYSAYVGALRADSVKLPGNH